MYQAMSVNDPRYSNWLSFKEKANLLYDHRFMYDENSYTSLKSKIRFTDKLSGIECEQLASNHLKNMPQKILAYDRLQRQKREFVSKLEAVWGNKYLYHLVDFKDWKTKIKIICPKHGEYEKHPSAALKGGCPICSKNKTSIERKQSDEKLLSIASEKYPDFKIGIEREFNTIYVVATCSKGHSFKRRYYDFLNSGCPQCNINNIIYKTISYEDFLIKVKNNFGDKYEFPREIADFSLANDISVICPKHGEITKRANLWYLGYGCTKCSYEERGINSRLTQEEFLESMSAIFGDKYDFSEAVYVDTDTEVKVIDKDGSSFMTTPKRLIQGYANPNDTLNRFETEILDFITSTFPEIKYETNKFSILPSGKQLDFYFPEHNFAIEFNGSLFHHSLEIHEVDPFIRATSAPKSYHYDKWKECRDNGIELLSIYDFKWIREPLKSIYKAKIIRALGKALKKPARALKIVSIDNSVAINFYKENHLDGIGILYKEAESYALIDPLTNEIYMSATIGKYWDQSSMKYIYKLQRICTLKDYVVIGGISKLSSFLYSKYGEFDYSITLDTGGSTLRVIRNYHNVNLRYYWVNRRTLEYKTRNECQVYKLKEKYKDKFLEQDTESSFMTRNGYLRVYDCGIVKLNYVSKK